MWGKITTIGCSRFIILIKRSDFFFVLSLPGRRCTADDILFNKALETITWATKDIYDFGFNLLDRGRTGSNPNYPSQQPLNLRPGSQPSTTDTISTLSARRKYFLCCLLRETTGNERVLAWKTNKESKGEKLTAERRTTLGCRAVGLWWDKYLAPLMHMCVHCREWSETLQRQ